MNCTTEIAEVLLRHGFRRFMMSRSPVGHLMLAGHIGGRPIDIVLDTGAAKTIVDLSYCRSEGIAVSDTGQRGAGAVGAGDVTVSVYTLLDARLTLDGLPVRTDGIFAIDMVHTNQKLKMKGVAPIQAVLGQDALRYHQAVIDYSPLALFLKEETGSTP
jgi:hypothetical protein